MGLISIKSVTKLNSPFPDLESEDPLQGSREEDVLGTAGEMRKKYIHGMHVFRMKLAHFVNSLHNYIMTRVPANFITLFHKGTSSISVMISFI